MAVKNKKSRKFNVEFFECGDLEFHEVSKAKEMVEAGNTVIATGEICNYRNGVGLRVRTAPIEEICIGNGHNEIVTSNHVYMVK